MSNLPFILAAVAAFCGGAIPVAGKIALEAFHPFTAVTLRFVLACIVLLPFVHAQGELSVARFVRLRWVSLAGALNPIILFLVLPLIKASITPFVFAAVPLLTAIYLYAVYGERITRMQTLGIGVGIFGVALVVILPVLEAGASLEEFAGNAFLLGAAVAVAAYGIGSKRHQKEGVSPLSLTFYFCVIGLLISLPFTGAELFVYGMPTPAIAHFANILFIGVIGTGVFYLVYQRALKIGTPVTAALYAYLQPVVTVGLAVIFLGEILTVSFLTGGVLAVTGAWLASKK